MNRSSFKIIFAFVFLFLIIILSIVLVAKNYQDVQKSKVQCVVTGCSNELCMSQEEIDSRKGVSICIWSDKFACYKESKCEVQSTGKCGWTANDEFNKCLTEKSNQAKELMLK